MSVALKAGAGAHSTGEGVAGLLLEGRFVVCAEAVCTVDCEARPEYCVAAS